MLTPWVEGFTNLFRQKYAGIISAGFTESQLGLSQDRVEWLKKSNLLVPCLNDSTKLQFNAVSANQFRKAAEPGFPEAEINRLWQVWESTIWNGEDLIQRLESDFPEIRTVIKLWDSTMLGGLSPTAVGIAIGHANLARLSGFKADLSIWIQ